MLTNIPPTDKTCSILICIHILKKAAHRVDSSSIAKHTPLKHVLGQD